MKKVLFSLCAATLLFTACKKDDSPTVSRVSLVTGSWKLNSFKLTIPLLAQFGQPSQINLLDTLGDCLQDDSFAFRADYRLYQYVGTVKCDSTDSQSVYLGPWSLLNNEKSLQLTAPRLSNVNLGTAVMQISELSKTTMHLMKDTVFQYSGVNLNGTADLVFVK